MAENSKIEWTDATWNPIRARRKDTGKVGWHCERVSPACRNCYAAAFNRRAMPVCGTGLDYTVPMRDMVEVFVDEKELLKPLSWKRGRMVFPCSMTDLFADFVTDEMRDRVFAVMALAKQHTFQVLTKRAARMAEYFAERWQGTSAIPEMGLPAGSPFGRDFVVEQQTLELAENLGKIDPKNDDHFTVDGTSKVLDSFEWPLPNVWLGATVEDQQRWDERSQHLKATPAVKRFISYEPALGPIEADLSGIDWVICGGESGRGARPMHPDWARSLRDQCKAAGVPFFMKQLSSADTRAYKDFEGFPQDLQIREFPPCA
jgi:protein gp37